MGKGNGHFTRFRALVDGGWLHALTQNELAMWLALEKFADPNGVAYPDGKVLARLIGHSNDNHIGRLRGQLVKHGLIEIVDRKPGRGNRLQVRVLTPPSPDQKPPKPEPLNPPTVGGISETNPPYGGGKNPPTVGAKTPQIERRHNKEELPINYPLTTHRGAAAPPADIDTPDSPLPDARPEHDEPAPTMAPTVVKLRRSGGAQAEVIAHFKTGWRKLYGREYRDRQLDYIKAADLLRACGGAIDDAKSAVDRYLADPWFKATAHAFASMLGGQLNKFLGDVANGTPRKSSFLANGTRPGEYAEDLTL